MDHIGLSLGVSRPLLRHSLRKVNTHYNPSKLKYNDINIWNETHYNPSELASRVPVQCPAQSLPMVSCELCQTLSINGHNTTTFIVENTLSFFPSIRYYRMKPNQAQYSIFGEGVFLFFS